MKKLILTIFIALATQNLAFADEPLLGDVRIFGFNFCPRGWAEAAGQILPINQNQALYSLLGTTYGGDGRTNFALPDLRGRTPISRGQGTGLQNRILGSKGGLENVTLTNAELPSHSHSLTVKQGGPKLNKVTPNPNSLYFAEAPIYRQGGTSTFTNAASTTNTGGGQAHNNMQPYQTIRYCIATVGIFPSRN